MNERWSLVISMVILAGVLVGKDFLTSLMNIIMLIKAALGITSVSELPFVDSFFRGIWVGSVGIAGIILFLLIILIKEQQQENKFPRR